MNIQSLSLVLASLVVILAGCGGGGGGGRSSPTPTVLPSAAITEGNKKQIAGTAIRGDFRSLGAFGGEAAGVVPVNPATKSGGNAGGYPC